MAYAETDRPAVGTRVRITGEHSAFSIGSKGVLTRQDGSDCPFVTVNGIENAVSNFKMEPLDAPPSAPSVTFGTGIGTLPRTKEQVKGYRKAAQSLMSDAKFWCYTPEGHDFWYSIYQRLHDIAAECERPEPALEVMIRTEGCDDDVVRATPSANGKKIILDTRDCMGRQTYTTPTEARTLAAGLIALADHVEKAGG